jgi:hypothetical protein
MPILSALIFYPIHTDRIKIGSKQEIETLINEEALLFAKYLRGEKKD